MSDDASIKPKRTRGLLEQSHSKHDIGPFRVGQFKFIVNYQHPPIDRRTRIITMCLIIGSMLIGQIAWLFVIAIVGHSHRIVGFVLNSLVYTCLAALAAMV